MQEKLIALTFDDGPDPEYTPQVLSLLAAQRAKATFFVTGSRAGRFPDLVQQIADQGHQVGNHGFQHISLRDVSADRFLAEVEKAHAVIQGAAGQAPRVFRPPYGEYAPHMVETLEQRGYRLIMWTIATNPNDSSGKRSAEWISGVILRGAKPGAIVLLHDHGGDRTPTVQALGEVLEKLSAQGYRFVTLDALLGT